MLYSVYQNCLECLENCVDIKLSHCLLSIKNSTYIIQFFYKPLRFV